MTLEDSVEFGVRRCVVSSVLNPIYKIEHVAVTSSVWVIINTRLEVPLQVVHARIYIVIRTDVKLKFRRLRYYDTLNLFKWYDN